MDMKIKRSLYYSTEWYTLKTFFLPDRISTPSVRLDSSYCAKRDASEVVTRLQ